MKQYVYLEAQFPDRLLEKTVMVSFQSGYIFIQTDKTLYTPNSKGENCAPLRLQDKIRPILFESSSSYHLLKSNRIYSRWLVEELVNVYEYVLNCILM